jgi:prepilin-type N-terminal cleavage/methylation domain-containing protein
MSKQKSFTLIELLVVIAVIGMLSSIVLVALGSSREKSRDARRQHDIRQIEKALLLYWDENEQFPGESYCDSSIGSCGYSCPCDPSEDNWSSSSGIWQGIVGNGIMGALPKDSLNNITYYYSYEPCCNQDCGGGRTCVGKGCCEYNVTASKLETTGVNYTVWGRWE